MSNIDFDENLILLVNADFQSRNAKITSFFHELRLFTKIDEDMLSARNNLQLFI